MELRDSQNAGKTLCFKGSLHSLFLGVGGIVFDSIVDLRDSQSAGKTLYFKGSLHKYASGKKSRI